MRQATWKLLIAAATLVVMVACASTASAPKLAPVFNPPPNPTATPTFTPAPLPTSTPTPAPTPNPKPAPTFTPTPTPPAPRLPTPTPTPTRPPLTAKPQDMVLAIHELPFGGFFLSHDTWLPTTWGDKWSRGFTRDPDSPVTAPVGFIHIRLVVLDEGRTPANFVAAPCVLPGNQTAAGNEVATPSVGDATKACIFRLKDGSRIFTYSTGMRGIALEVTGDALWRDDSDASVVEALASVARAQLVVVQRAYAGKAPLHAIAPTPTPKPTFTPTPSPTMVTAPSNPTVYQVYGIVSDQNGTPLSGVCIAIGSYAMNCVTATDSNGYYRLSWPGYRTFSDVIHVRKDGYQTIGRYLLFPAQALIPSPTPTPIPTPAPTRTPVPAPTSTAITGVGSHPATPTPTPTGAVKPVPTPTPTPTPTLPPTPTSTRSVGEGSPRDVCSDAPPDWFYCRNYQFIDYDPRTNDTVRIQGPTLRLDLNLQATALASGGDPPPPPPPSSCTSEYGTLRIFGFYATTGISYQVSGAGDSWTQSGHGVYQLLAGTYQIDFYNYGGERFSSHRFTLSPCGTQVFK